MASFPTSIKSFTDLTDNVSALEATQMNQAYEEIEAIETALGTNLSNLYNSTNFEFAIQFVFGSGLSAISATDFQPAGWVEIPRNCEICGCKLVADAAGSIVIDIWKQAYASLPASDTDTITGGAEPTLSTAQTSSANIASWTTALTKGDWLYFNVDSASIVKQVTLSLMLNATT